MSEEKVPYSEFVARLAASPDNFHPNNAPYDLLALELEKLNNLALPLDHLKRVITYGDKLRMQPLCDLNEGAEGLRGHEFAGNLAHALLGIITEAIELVPILHQLVLDDDDVDRHNLREELGDLRFYQQLAMNTIETTPEQIDDINRRKLQKRYDGLVFNAEQALNRDLQAEREELERDV